MPRMLVMAGVSAAMGSRRWTHVSGRIHSAVMMVMPVSSLARGRRVCQLGVFRIARLDRCCSCRSMRVMLVVFHGAHSFRFSALVRSSPVDHRPAGERELG
jgi:hypothetical protein